MKNWIKNLPLISGNMKMKSQSVDKLIGEINSLRYQITALENEVRMELREAEDLAIQHWTREEITEAKK